MRKFLISILLAGAAASPAFAQDQGDRGERDDRGHRHEQQQQQQGDRQQVREERQQAREQIRAERGADGPQFQMRQQQFEARQQQFEARQQQVQAQQQEEQQGFDRRQRADGVSRWTRDNVQQAGETSRWTRDPNQRAGETGSWTRDRSGWTGERTTIRDYGDFRPSRSSEQRVTERSRWTSGSWNRDWRNDRRYDWRRYRNSHRSVFRLGIYLDPFGYNYRPYSIGYRLIPAYYSQNYWFDSAMYGLPYPPPGTRWVRYWDDALLVDLYTGEVVDVIQNFFW